MVSEREKESRVINPFLNPLEFWQNYLTNWIQASRGIYENTIKSNEYWFKVFWEPWFRAAGETKRKEE
jgi:hypothetical protein